MRGELVRPGFCFNGAGLLCLFLFWFPRGDSGSFLFRNVTFLPRGRVRDELAVCPIERRLFRNRRAKMAGCRFR